MKQFAKRMLGPVYPVLVRIKSGDFVTNCLATTGAPAYRRLRRASYGNPPVDIYQRCGIGAVITQALRFYNYADQRSLDTVIISTNPLYAARRGKDFLSDYFERSGIVQSKALRGRAYDWALWRVIDTHVPLADATRLFNQHFRPNKRVRQAIAEVMGSRAAFDFSVHYRGTDKMLESGQVSEEKIFAAIDDVLLGLDRPADVFLATDDAAFDARIRAQYSACRFTSYNLGSAEPGVARHFSNISADEKALEAIVNIFLIAAAPICIRTSSYLSAISKIANPAMATRTVNITLKGSKLFPEREIINAERRNVQLI